MLPSDSSKTCHIEKHKSLYEAWKNKSAFRQTLSREPGSAFSPTFAENEMMEGAFVCPDCNMHAKDMALQENPQSSSHLTPTKPSNSPALLTQDPISNSAYEKDKKFSAQDDPDLLNAIYSSNPAASAPLTYKTGSIGTVFYNNNEVIKVLNAKQLSKKSLTELENHYYMTTKAVKSAYLLALHTISLEPGHYSLTMPFMKNGTLYDFIHHSETPLPFPIQIKFAFQMASALQALHEHEIIHGEFNSNNIYLTDDDNLKVADYGLHFVKEEIRTRRSQTNALGFSKENDKYYSPELLTGESKNTKASDMYAYATVLWELLTTTKPWHNKNPFDLLNLVAKSHCREPIPENTPKIFHQIITACWEHNPQNRFTAKDIVDKLRCHEANKTNQLTSTIFNSKATGSSERKRKRKGKEEETESSGHHFFPH